MDLLYQYVRDMSSEFSSAVRRKVHDFGPSGTPVPTYTLVSKEHFVNFLPIY